MMERFHFILECEFHELLPIFEFRFNYDLQPISCPSDFYSPDRSDTMYRGQQAKPLKKAEKIDFKLFTL